MSKKAGKEKQEKVERKGPDPEKGTKASWEEERAMGLEEFIAVTAMQLREAVSELPDGIILEVYFERL